jgi:predicted signal transduction protein with EAL and GGDEF domain
LLLQAFAARVKAILRDPNPFARLGGDEFALIMRKFDNDDDLARIASRILKALDEPFRIEGINCQIGASIGIEICLPDSDSTSETVLQRADMALYRAKGEGRSTYRYFEPAMDEKVRERSRIQMDLERGIRSNEIKPYYQPLVHLSDGRIEGYEILARWEHPTHGLIPPDKFISVAEDTGLIDELCLCLLDQACRDSKQWPVDTYMALNISPVQLRDQMLPKKLMTVLERHNYEPRLLEIEITENALIYDITLAGKILNEIKKNGIGISLDDFGTGYSSLQHLRELPFDKIKIDGSFIMTMQDSAESRKIVDAVVALGKSLGLKTTAEGIETMENAAWLKDIGCMTGQGYVFGRPKQAGEIAVEIAAAAGVSQLRKIISDNGLATAAKAHDLPRQKHRGTP